MDGLAHPQPPGVDCTHAQTPGVDREHLLFYAKLGSGCMPPFCQSGWCTLCKCCNDGTLWGWEPSYYPSLCGRRFASCWGVCQACWKMWWGYRPSPPLWRTYAILQCSLCHFKLQMGDREESIARSLQKRLHHPKAPDGRCVLVTVTPQPMPGAADSGTVFPGTPARFFACPEKALASWCLQCNRRPPACQQDYTFFTASCDQEATGSSVGAPPQSYIVHLGKRREHKKNRPWQDSNLQSPAPEAGALSIRPQGLLNIGWKGKSIF